MQLDRLSVTEQMKLEEDRRNTIEARKEEEKRKAEAEVYSGPVAVPDQR